MDAGELMHRLARSAIRLAIRLPGKLLAALLGVFLLVGPLAAPASAHAQLQSTTPQAGARLDRPPGAISIRFDEKVTAAAGGIRVYDAAAKRVPTDSTTSTGTSMTIRLPDLADGAYVVVWQAVSVDGHPVRGSLTFQVGDGDQATVTAFGEQQLANASTDSTVPARASVSRPISIRVQTNSTRSDVTVDPARLGPNVIHIYVFGLDGTTLPIDDASFELTHLATGTIVEVDPFKAGRGHEQAQGVQLPFTGTWLLVTRIYLSEFEVEQSTSTFQVK